MNKIYLKHLGLSIPDLRIEYLINKERQNIKLKLVEHLDSQLLIDFLRRLETEEKICIVDNRSDDTIFNPLEKLFTLEIDLCGLVFDTKIVRMGSWLSKPGLPNFTISMQLRK